MRPARPAEPRRLAAASLLAAAMAACAGGTARPVPVDAIHDACDSCRMTVSDPHFSAELVAPGEEPRFFDDLRCLREYLLRAPALPPRAVVYVADHRTGGWVRASRAVYAQVPALSTPMGSHWVAYADAASRDADPYARGAMALPAAAIFADRPPPDGDGEKSGGGDA